MVRWITFDDDTADALVGKFKRGAAEISAGDALTVALKHEGPSILVYPSTSPERVLVARVTPAKEPARQLDPTRPLPAQSVHTNASAARSAKKPWWRRTA